MFAKNIVTRSGDKSRDEYSLAFDGSNDYIEINSVFNYNVHSISTWIKEASRSGQSTVFDHRDANNDGIHLYLASGEPLYQVNNADGHYTTALALNQWHHIVCTNDGSTSTIYVNGVAVETADTSGETVNIAGTYPLRIGARSHTSADNYFNGNISEMAIYNSALTASQVKTIYNGREPYNHKEGVASGNLQAWYRMGDGLEKNKGLHSLGIGELITVAKDKNMDSSNNWDVSSANWSIDGNSLDYDGSGGGSSALDQTYPSFTQGRTYEIKFNTSASTIVTIKDGDGSNTFVAEDTYSSGTKTVTFVAPATTDGLMFTAGGSSGAFAIDWVNVKEFNVYDMSDNTNDGKLMNMTTIDFEGDAP